MIRRRVAWDGPNPHPGDYLTEPGGGFRRILLVEPLRHVDASGARLELHMAEIRVAKKPADAAVHPHVRAAQADPAGPQRVRQVAGGGANAVMRSEWRDPADVKPTAAREAKRVAGYRTYCPLRRMASRRGSQVTREHILAADHFRLLADLASIGARSDRDIVGSDSGGYGPRTGPTAADAEAAAASRETGRFLALITHPMQRMLTVIVLQNNSLQAWCNAEAARRGEHHRVQPDVEMGRLLALLDLLAQFYAGEVETAVQTGRLLEPAA